MQLLLKIGRLKANCLKPVEAGSLVPVVSEPGVPARPAEVVHANQVLRQRVPAVVPLVAQVALVLDLLTRVLLQVVALQGGLSSAGEVAT